LRSSEYLTRRPLLWGAVEASLQRLLNEYELVVIEGPAARPR